MPRRSPIVAPAVTALLADLAHPLEPAIHVLRQAVSAADPRIEEGIKWNAPSFHLGGAHFATFHLRGRDGVQLVLHLGAKARPDATVRDAVPDHDGLLVWKSADRATFTVRDTQEARARAAALTTIVRAWLPHV